MHDNPIARPKHAPILIAGKKIPDGTWIPNVIEVITAFAIDAIRSSTTVESTLVELCDEMSDNHC